MRWSLLAVLVVVAGCGGAGNDAAKPLADTAGKDRLLVTRDGWKTDFSRHSVPLSEFSAGGPPRDGIPPLDEPKIESVRAADAWLEDREPVLVAEVGSRARAYPVQILVWHEIANDVLGRRPLAVTYCPLCNSSLVFDRRVDGRVLRFGTTGNLRRSDLVMWDRQTESWWQQLTGEGVVGRLTGTKLTVLPSQTLSWGDFKARFPRGDVLSRDTGHDRDYGRNPYEGYDAPDSEPFLFNGKTDRRLPPKERVVAIRTGRSAVVVPLSRLERKPVVQLEIDDRPVAILFKRGVVSALDAGAISRSRDVGTAATFDRRLAGRRLTFTSAGSGRFRDRETGSSWDITGRATDGPLAGRRLAPVVSDQQFWFALAAFLPDAKIAG